MRTPFTSTLAAASASLMAVTLAACAGAGGAGAGSDVIRLGVIGPMSGAQAEIGENQLAGAEVAAAQINAEGGIDGKQISIVSQDEGGSPDAAAAAIRRLSNDDVDLQLGMLSSANCLATAPTLPRLQVVMVSSGCTNDGLTGQDGEEAPYENFFRVGTHDSLLVETLAGVVAEEHPDVTDYSAFGYDYVTGTSQWELYQETLQEAGVDLGVQDETFVALGEQNFKPYVQALSSASGDPTSSGLYLGTYGAGTASFLQQAQDLDLASKFEVLVQPGGYYPVARTLGGRAPKMWNAYDYNYAAFDTKMNEGFIKDFEDKAGKKPISWSYGAYLAVYAYKAAIEEAGSTESGDVLKALPGIEFESPAGPLTIDETTHQANTPVVVTLSMGDAKAPEDVRIIESRVVEPES